MTTVVRSHQILVRAPLQSAFDYVSDLTRHPEWSSGQLKIEAVPPGPSAVGREYISRGEVAGQKDRPNRVQITEFESPHKFGFVANDPGFGKVSHVFTFTEHEGGVLIKRVMTLSLNPILAFLFRFLIYPLIGSPAMDKSLALLKAKLEEDS
ncbi:MAG: SRPBCC family protein [Chloroflexi bacterium]|nr:MAG: SRPBCC family protein [Chloroflexota bacterium]